MGAGKPRLAVRTGAAAPGLALSPLLMLVALLVSGCATMRSSSASLAPGLTPGPDPVTATVTPQTVPVLGSMSYGTFPASTDGMAALDLCEQWAVLRDEYVARLRADTPYQLEQWFSGPAWLPAFQDNRPLKNDPDFSQINTAFTLASTGAAASVSNAKLLDEACAGAD